MSVLRILPVVLGLALVAGNASGAAPQTPAKPSDKVTTAPQPQQGGPGTDPGQGRDTKLVALADLLLIDAMTVGTQQIAWGAAANVPASAASEKKSGKCAFRYKYTVKNQGVIASVAAVNRVRLNLQTGPVLASVGMAPLAVNATQNSSGLLWLKPGTSTLYVHTDNTAAVAESNEANNLRRVRVTVQGSCGP